MPRDLTGALPGAIVAIALAGGLVAALPAAAQTAAAPGEAPDLELAQTLIAEGRPLEAFQLLEPFEVRFAGDLTSDYLLARSALDAGDPSRASFIYERILAVEPNYVGVRLESGRAYLELENYARAKQEFDIVLRFDDLPPDLRQAAEQYARVAEERLDPKKTFFSFFGEYGFGYDGNANSGTRDDIVVLPSGLLVSAGTQKLSSFYHGLNAGAQVVHRVTENWNVFAGANYAGRLNVQESALDSHDVEGRAGIGYATGTDNVRLSTRYGRFFFNDDAIRDVHGYTLDWLHGIDERNQVTTSLAFSRFRFDDPDFKPNDYNSYVLTGTWNHAFAEGKALLGISGNVGTENARKGRLDGDAVSGGLSISVQATVTDTVGVFAAAGVQRVNYKDQNIVFEETRLDTQYSVSGGVNWGFATGWSLRPQVSWSKNLSNIPTNAFERLDVSVNLRKDF